MKFLRLSHGKERLTIVAILDERTFDTRALTQNRFSRYSAHSDAGWNKQAVLHRIGSGTDGQSVTRAQEVRGLLKRCAIAPNDISRAGLSDGDRARALSNCSTRTAPRAHHKHRREQRA